MQGFSFHDPVRLVFGAGSIGTLGEHASQWGAHALLVTGRGFARRCGLLDRACSLLADRGLQVTVFDRIRPNPDDGTVNEGAELARSAGCDVVVAVGGGSAMDSAKGMAVAATHDAPIADFLKVGDRRQPTDATLPIVCATTTFGTSSELTRFAVITVEDRVQKAAIANDNVYPKVAIVDPGLAVGCPAGITASTGMDVLAHAVEGYFSTAASPVTDLCAERAMELVASALPVAMADLDALGPREQLALADVFAGFELSNCGTGVLHSLEHPISAHYPDVAHGAGLAVMMVTWAETLWDRDPYKFGRIACLLGADVADMSEEDAARRAAPALADLLETVGLDIGLGDLGIEREKLPTIADDAMHYMAAGLAKTPGGLDRDQLIELLEASF